MLSVCLLSLRLLVLHLQPSSLVSCLRLLSRRTTTNRPTVSAIGRATHPTYIASRLHSSARHHAMSADAASSGEKPIYEQSIASMKKYLDEYGVSHKDCIEKAEIVARVRETLANPPAKKPPADENKVGEAIVKLLGDKLQAKTGKFNTAKLQAKVVALYFSAHWCGPCRSFTPVLRQLYSDSLKKAGVEVVFVSSDQDDSSFDGYFADMPWLALPFDEREIKDELSSQFRIQGIPSLIVLDAKTGKIISNDGRTDVMREKGAVAAMWIKKSSSKA